MSACPNCRFRLTPADEQARVCPRCRADLSIAKTFELASASDTAELDPTATIAPPPSAADATIDLAASAFEIRTVETSPQPGPGGKNSAATSEEASARADGGRKPPVPVAGPPVNRPDATMDLRDGATIDLPAADDRSQVSIELIQHTWEGADGTLSPNMTLKPPSAPAKAQTASLVVRDREVRPAQTDGLAMADYDLIERLGEGGMGVVYTARQASIDRTVAVKMLKPRMAQDEGQKQKFVSEAVVTGELDHPNIVPIYELGRNSDGSLFYSMKKIQGIPWMDILPKKSLVENLEILMKVADAVAFAHSRGVVHRDLKPENIMLGEFGEALVLDWGLALTTSDCRKTTTLTAPVGMGGTPTYMAPEMVLGPVEKIGKHSDIYLLGAILYECVTGDPPHQGQTAMQCLFAAGKNEIRPTKQRGELVDIALRAMATDPAERYASVREFQQAIRAYQSHSESIALTARATEELERAEQQDDYQQLARALYVFQEASELWPENTQAKAGVGSAKLAYAESAYRKGDFDLGLSIVDVDNPEHKTLVGQLKRAQVDRNARQQRLRNAKRAIGGLALLVFLAVTAGMLLFLSQKNIADRQRAIAVANEREANQQRDEADRQRAMALQNETEAKRQEQIAVGQRARAETSEQDAIEKRQRAEYEAYIAWIGLADSKIKENALGQARNVLEQCTAELRDWEWYRLMLQCQQGLSRIDVGQRLDCVAVSPDAALIAAGSRDGVVRVWDAGGGGLRHELQIEPTFATSIAFSPVNSQLLAIASGEPGKFLQLWDLESGDVSVVPVDHTDRVTSVAFSPDGTLLLTASLDNTAEIWNLAGLRQEHVLRGHSWWVWSAQFSRDGRQIVTASQDGTVRIWDTASGQQLRGDTSEVMPFRAHQGPVHTASFSPDGQWVASGGYDGRILLWRVDDLQSFNYTELIREDQQAGTKDGVPFQQLEGHTAAISRIVFSHDGRLIVSAGHDNLIKAWWALDEMLDGQPVPRGALYKSLRGHDSLVRDVTCSPKDDNLLVSASYDGQIRLWAIRDYEESRVIPGVMLRGHSDAILQAGFSPDGARIVTASRDRSARVWNAQDGRPELVLREGHSYLTSAALFFPVPHGPLLTAAVDGTARIWNRDTGTQEAVLPGIGPGAAAAVSPDGRWVATSAGRDGVHGVAPKEARSAILWDAQTRQVVRALAEHQAAVSAVAFSADSRLVFTGDANGRGNLWNVETGKLLATARRHTGRITAAAFTPSGEWLLTSSEDKTVFSWKLSSLTSSDSAARIELVADDARVLRHPDAVTSLALTAEGDTVLTGCQDGVARRWDGRTATVVWQWQSEAGGNINAVDISPLGSLALVVDAINNLVCLLDLEAGHEIRIPNEAGGLDHFLNLRQRGAVGWSAHFTPEGDAVVTVGGDEARMWDLQGRERLSFGPHRTVSSASFSTDGERIVTASWDNSAKVWDAKQGRPLLKLDDHVAGPLQAHRARVNSAVFSTLERQIVTASDDGTLRVWDAETGQVLRVLAGHQGPVLHAAYSPDGRWIVSSSRDATAIVWDVATGQLLRQLSGHKLAVLQAAFSADGKRIITGSEDFRAIIWDAVDGQAQLTFPDQTDRVTSVAFSPSGTRVLTGCADQSIKLWDATTGREILTLTGHTREVTSVSFSADGRSALSSSRDGTAIVWPSIPSYADGRYEFDVPTLSRVR